VAAQTDVGTTPNAAAGATPAISVRGVTKRFGAVTAVDDMSLDVAAGEFFALLGPSGSGKTTMLRMIAGFELPTSGTVLLDGADVTNRPPFERDVNTVFQDYALFPHMTVAKNIEYGLKVKRVAKAERTRRVEEALATIRLEEMGGRRPQQLSGGQRQRVALARALVNRPRVLLLDEPLGALDLKLREEMQVELKTIQRDVGITFVFVTHDQGEALSMSDRIAVFNHGRIEQVAAPHALYEDPASEFVAGFVGASNLLRGDVARRLLGVDGPVAIRPERVRVLGDGDAPGTDAITATGTITSTLYLGHATRVGVDIDGATLLVDVPNRGVAEAPRLGLGAAIRIAFARDDAGALAAASAPDSSGTTRGENPV
jgi:putative spermidine/putrescine transport system ATP-binding protein